MKERWYSCQGSRLCMLSTAFNWSKITFGATNLIFQIRAGWTDFRALPSLSLYSHLIIHISAYRQTNKYFNYLRAAVCKYREFAVKTEISPEILHFQSERTLWWHIFENHIQSFQRIFIFDKTAKKWNAAPRHILVAGPKPFELYHFQSPWEERRSKETSSSLAGN